MFLCLPGTGTEPSLACGLYFFYHMINSSSSRICDCIVLSPIDFGMTPETLPLDFFKKEFFLFVQFGFPHEERVASGCVIKNNPYILGGRRSAWDFADKQIPPSPSAFQVAMVYFQFGLTYNASYKNSITESLQCSQYAPPPSRLPCRRHSLTFVIVHSKCHTVDRRIPPYKETVFIATLLGPKAFDVVKFQMQCRGRAPFCLKENMNKMRQFWEHKLGEGPHQRLFHKTRFQGQTFQIIASSIPVIVICCETGPIMTYYKNKL